MVMVPRPVVLSLINTIKLRMIKLFLSFKMGFHVFPDWSQTHYMAKDGLELLILMSAPLKC